MRLHLVDRCLVAVVDAVGDAKAVADLLHLRVFLLLQRDRIIGPEVVERDGQAANVDDILAFAADRVGEGLKMRLAEGLVLDELNIPISVLLLGRLVHDDFDAGGLSPTEHRLKRFAVIGYHADHVDLLCDQILDGSDLLRRVVGCRIDDRGVDAEFLSGLRHPLGDIVEPGDLHLSDNADLHGVVGRPDDWRGQYGKRSERASAFNHGSPSDPWHFVSPPVLFWSA